MISTDPATDTHRYPTTDHRERDGYDGHGYRCLSCKNDDEALASARREMPETTMERLERREGDAWVPCHDNPWRNGP